MTTPYPVGEKAPDGFEPVKVGIIGVGGYAAYHLLKLEQLEAEGWCRLQACADPQSVLLEQTAHERRFEERGVATYATHTELLTAQAARLDFVIVPTPLPLHARMHRDCVEAGVACYLEKPPSLYLPELEEMVATDRAAVLPTQVGFNWREEPARLRIKQLACSGQLGKLKTAKLKVLWQREASYYQRNKWNGRLFQQDRPVLDSCIGNAASHFLNLLLWHAGTSSVEQFATPAQLEAELYRAHEIQSFDTAFLRGRTTNVVDFVLAVSHACEEELFNEEVFEFEDATVTWRQDHFGEVRWTHGEVEELPTCPEHTLSRCLRHYIRFLRGLEEAPLQTLADCRPFIQLTSMALLSCPEIHAVETHPQEEDGARIIPGISEAAHELWEAHKLPFEAGYPWAQPTQLVYRDALLEVEEAFRTLKERTTQTSNRESEDLLSTH